MQLVNRLFYKLWDLIILNKLIPHFSWLLARPVCLLGFGFGSGLAPIAPGTFGTLPALPLAWGLIMAGVSLSTYLVLVCIMFLAGVYICGETERQLGIQDYGGIVWDEIVAMMLLLAFVPLTWLAWLLAFIVFRFFDAVKPWPIKWLDSRIHGGLGIMIDDIIAAVFSIAVMYILF